MAQEQEPCPKCGGWYSDIRYVSLCGRTLSSVHCQQCELFLGPVGKPRSKFYPSLDWWVMQRARHVALDALSNLSTLGIARLSGKHGDDVPELLDYVRKQLAAEH